MIRQTVLLVVLACIASACSAQGSDQSLRKPPMGYELYSWKEPNGSWDFCLLPSPSGVNIPSEEVFNKKFLLRGMNALSREVSRLPIGATIYWLDHIVPETDPKTKESESLRYPSASIIEKVRRYSERRRIEVQMLRRAFPNI